VSVVCIGYYLWLDQKHATEQPLNPGRREL
jgi:hypothetical protein